MYDFVAQQKAQTYHLTNNYRSCNNIVQLSNLFLAHYFPQERLKANVELKAHQTNDGIINYHFYKSKYLITPLINQLVAANLTGTIAVLTHTNEEAILAHNLLQQQQLPAQLILNHQDFKLKNLLELYTFTHLIYQCLSNENYGLITNELWTQQKERLIHYFPTSNNLKLVHLIIEEFEKTHPQKFKSDWKEYLEEIRVEDFYFPEQQQIFVATMHKAKGKEFDHVFLLLHNYELQKDENIRVLYVAMTRAKKQLHIHANKRYFRGETINNLQHFTDNNLYAPPNKLILQCSMKDIRLDFFQKENTMHHIKTNLQAGELLSFQKTVRKKEKATKYLMVLNNQNGKTIVRFSKAFSKRLNNYFTAGYKVTKAKATYIVVWYSLEAEQTYRIVLPQIVLQKTIVQE